MYLVSPWGETKAFYHCCWLLALVWIDHNHVHYIATRCTSLVSLFFLSSRLDSIFTLSVFPYLCRPLLS